MTGALRTASRALALLAIAFGGLAAAPVTEAQQKQKRAGARDRSGSVVVLRTIPRLEGVTFSVGGRRFRSDRRGRVRLPLASRAQAERRVRIADATLRPGVRARFSGWYRGRPTFAIYYAVRLEFVDVDGRPVDPAAIESVELLSSNGLPKTYPDFDASRRLWLQGRGIVPAGRRQESKGVSQTVESVEVDGSNVVNQGQQRFYPARSREALIELLFFSARFEIRDALFGFPIGSEIRLRYPSGRVERHAVGSDGELEFRSLPRGSYEVGVEAAGWSFDRPMSLSRDQDVRLQVISYFDIATMVVGLIAGALLILFIGRPYLIPVFGKRFARPTVPASDR